MRGLVNPTRHKAEDAVHVLFQATDAEAGAVVANKIKRDAATQFVQLHVVPLQVHAVGTQLLHVFKGTVKVVVVNMSVVVTDCQVEYVVLWVGSAEELAVWRYVGDADVLFEVDDLRLDGVGVVHFNHLRKWRFGLFVLGFQMVPVGFYRRIMFGEAHLAANEGAVVAVEILVGDLYHLFTGEVHPALVVAEPFLIVGTLKLKTQEQVGDAFKVFDLPLLRHDAGGLDAL